LRDGVYASGPGAAGSNAILVNFIGALDAPRANGLSNGALQTAAEAAAGLASLRGVALQAAQTEAAQSDVFRDALAEAELAVTGVDTDAELQQLLLIEQAYAANARVIEVAGRLIDQLTEL
jgi:flagellar hook-associated protein 1 FlgK